MQRQPTCGEEKTESIFKIESGLLRPIKAKATFLYAYIRGLNELILDWY